MDLRSSLPKSDKSSLPRRVGDGDGRSAALMLHLLSSLENGESSFQLVEGGLGVSFPSIIIFNKWFKTRIRFSDIPEFSDLLFDKLQEQFDWLLSGMSHPAPSTFTRSYREELILLFRCCMHMLPVLEFNLSLVVEKCAVVLSIVRRLCSPGCRIKELNEEARRQMFPFFCRVLEVFLEEFLMDCQIRKHLMITDKISSTAEKIFVYDGSCGNAHVIQEIIFGHFLLSANDEWMFNRFFNSLSWENEIEDDVSELSLTTSLLLLGKRNMFLMPCLLEAHLILWASKCISIQKPNDDWRSNERLTNFHIIAFENSVNVYEEYISILKFVANTNQVHAQPSDHVKKLQFDSFIHPATHESLQHRMNCLINFCCLNSQGFLSETKEDITHKSLSFIKRNGHILDGMYLDEACLILQYIILNILSERNDTYGEYQNGSEIQPEIFCFAAVLKLMSSSLLQMTWTLKENAMVSSTQTSENKFASREYNFMSDIISRFRKYNTSEVVKTCLLDVIGTKARKHESCLMFAHFASLLSYSFVKKLVFLWSNCIIVMMTILNLIIFEDGNLDIFTELVVKYKEMIGPSPQVKTAKAITHRSPSSIIASNFQEYRMAYSRKKGKEQASEGDTCNGDNFLQWYLPGYQENSAAFSDLADLIECKPGVDYSRWLKNRRRFNKWLLKKRHRLHPIGSNR
ncbi:uncharacterized protein LOC122045217 isoform X1 [Zingiber officinale]|uniref:DUF7812 domain-containing protein n=1 Tax=Zingiber officinale TaxID=94328 RepID=A0A8J5H9K8_ZINOF|nr:uncharacterized protein LOC122045217 isoform X1 [Zingiber officinale]KAG6523386.1 hypothetical protein ZIOFF_013243 [Zingiber officinale]